MFNYDATADTALQLIGEFGQDVTFTREGDDQEFDPITGAVTAVGTPQSTSSKALRIKVNPGLLGNQDIKLLEGVIRGEVTGLLIAAKGLTFILRNNDVVTLANGSKWTLLGAIPLDPAGTPIVYKALLRKQ